MKRFRADQFAQALRWAADGGQALCLHRVGARLYDRDEARLRATVYRLGVRQPVIRGRGTVSQHAPLVGRPERRAKAHAEVADWLFPEIPTKGHRDESE